MAEMSSDSDGVSRRKFLQVTAAGAAGLAVSGTTVGLGVEVAEAAAAGRGAVRGLSVAGRFDHPLGVDNRTPLLAWRLERGTQHAYRIRAASSTAKLPDPDLWDTGWVRSGTSTGVAYAGKPLGARQQVVWQVRITDAHGTVSEWSAPSAWELGLLDRSDWSPAVWIEHPDRENIDPLPVFARGFTVDDGRTVDRARLYLAGLGAYDATLNGRRVTDAVHLPGDSNPQRSVEAGTYDVTELLESGPNVLGVQLGNGIFNAVEVTNPAVGRTEAYNKFTSEIVRPTTLATAAGAGDTSIKVADVDGFDVGATVNIDTGNGGTLLESRVITKVGTAGADGSGIGFTEPLAHGHDAGGTVTHSGTANETRTAISPRLLARLEVGYADGSIDTVVTDRQWRTALGPSVTDSWYAGTDYDARREQPGWDRPGADLSAAATRRNGEPTGWIAAGIAPPPNLATDLAWRQGDPVEIVDTVAPVAVTEPKPGTWVFDFGQNFSALFDLRLDASVPAGTVIKMRPAESLHGDGTVDASSMGSDEHIYDTYTTAGASQGERWRPQFVYHGFQYVQLTGLPSGHRATSGMLTALPIRASMDVAGDVSTSSDMVNRIHRMSTYSIASNTQSIFTDCPNREKLGWLADVLHSIQAIDRNFEMSAYLPHMQRVMREAQLASGPSAGMVPAHAPEFPVFGGGYRDDINWGSSVIVLPWWLWQHHGDTATMAEYYPDMVGYHDFVRTVQAGADGGTNLVRGGLGDWVAADDRTPKLLTGTYAYYRMTDKLARMAAALGKNADARRYSDLAADIKAEFNARFFNDTLRAYTNEGNGGTVGTQADDALALDAGLVPDGQEKHVLDDLVRRIHTYHPSGGGPHLSGGTISLGPTFRALTDGGRADVVWDVLHETTRPSYGAFLRPSEMNPHGMTTVPEHWHAPENSSSLNHMILLQIDEWFSTGLAGIRRAPGSVAYGKVVVKPRLVGTDEHPLTHVEGHYDGPRGRISSSWRLKGQGSRDFELDVVIPANSVGEIHVPTIRPQAVWLNGRHVRASKEVKFESYTDGCAVYSVGPGSYGFSSQPHQGGGHR
ncbi:alpha-L-rhamnosidase [Actinopolyspora alba]|uniref:alpha-L-rhamnosidase n=1 Tax=Actinopolyspora alba TaxID=673379 RepID=A0A1I2ABH5_9ACTN|nr:alpha-L-rhamnosidase [Actinopolyspora alba]SFE41321.1 alpha-L-rhamnosidase [Actinopolyspora alba]